MICLVLSADPAILRRPDGSIDTDRYLAEARRLRAEMAHRLLLPAAAAEFQPPTPSALPAT